MGKRSARIFLCGKDHKDVFFDGHYHNKIYMADDHGNITLVWEKIRDNRFVFTVNPASALILSVWGEVAIDWGDGNGNKVDNNGRPLEYQYGASDKKFRVQITGDLKNIKFNWGNGMNGALSEVLTILPYSVRNTEDFSEIFSGCTNLEYIPEKIFHNCVRSTSFRNAFWACRDLRSIPEKLFAGCPNVEDFGGVFMRCSGLENIPEKLFANCAKVKTFNNAFQYCNFSIIPEDLFASCPDVEDFSGLFFGCENPVTVPEGLFAGCPMAKDFSVLFALGGLEVIPERLFAGCPDASNFASAFEYCQNIKGRVPELWVSHSQAEKHSRCFFGCTKAENYESIPDGWKG